MKTPEEYSGMTLEEIKDFLTEKERFVWIRRKKLAVLDYIEHLLKKVADAEAAIEEQDAVISLMQIQMEGDCGCCKHKNDRGPCAQCRSIAYHPDWEYEGLPEIPGGYVLPKKGES